ncbi:hypothetical protein CcCBS67573_g03453 [Chytriomyces confervae]|uniref:C2H2-type domain-containing protein n=1 Tax=Chytriomyces confervae TaxID=246404 RepID=A0A507FJN1_9FUNG|nr:hypothetical protein CcCBS67573_g03453 [Chytriomyces confervae]
MAPNTAADMGDDIANILESLANQADHHADQASYMRHQPHLSLSSPGDPCLTPCDDAEILDKSMSNNNINNSETASATCRFAIFGGKRRTATVFPDEQSKSGRLQQQQQPAAAAAKASSSICRFDFTALGLASNKSVSSMISGGVADKLTVAYPSTVSASVDQVLQQQPSSSSVSSSSLSIPATNNTPFTPLAPYSNAYAQLFDTGFLNQTPNEENASFHVVQHATAGLENPPTTFAATVQFPMQPMTGIPNNHNNNNNSNNNNNNGIHAAPNHHYADLFICRFPGCGKQFDRKFNFEKHCKTHDEHRPRNFVCHTCNKSFLRAYDLKRHTEAHQDVEAVGPEYQSRIVCEHCGKRYSRPDALVRHSRICKGAVRGS